MAVAPGAEIVGRDVELAAIGEFLDSADGLPAVLLIRGDAGVGKTTLWEQALELGRERSFRVLSHRASAAETQLSYAALGDLLRDVVEEALAELPAPQHRGLEVALLLEEPGERPPEPQAIAAGFLGALSRLALAGPLLVAVDDVQWLDRSSATALAFALRRLREEPIAVVLAQRAEPGQSPSLVVEGELPRAVLRRLELGPLSLGAVHRLLTVRIGATFARPTLRRLFEISGGNPFFALELARALHNHGRRLEPGEPWPLPTDLHELLRDRLSALPAATRGALLTVAALSQPTVELVEEALNVDAEKVLQPALDAHVIGLGGDAIRFSHPLLASAVQGQAGPAAQRSCHRRLAEVVDDFEERARHLALAAEGPDGEIASALDEAADRARDRGAPRSAGELAEHALRLTPLEDRDDALHRMLAGAGHHFDAGDAPRGRLLLETAATSASSGPQRAEALTSLARAHVFEADNRTAARLYGEALAEADEESAIRAEAEGGLAVALMRMLEDLPAAGRHAKAAADLAERRGDVHQEAELRGNEALIESLLGRPDASTVMERAGKLEEATRAVSARSSRILPGLGPPFVEAVLLLWTDRLADARSLMESAYDRAVELGDEGSLPLILRYLSSVEWLAGNWAEASRWADEGHEAAIQTGQPSQQAVLLGCRALVDAHLGRIDSARVGAQEALTLANETGAMFGTMIALSALGFLELSLADPAAANEHLRPLVERLEAAGVGQPGATRFIPDEIEALIALGRLDEAEELLSRLEQRAKRLDHPSAVAAGWRCRGLLQAAQGDLPAALRALDRALTNIERVPMPFDRARTLLALGQLQRRSKQKRAGRESLKAALAGFEKLGARLWAGKARAELGRIGGRVPTGELTATERRVAELVAQGLANKEVAAELVVTVRAVEANLTRIYAKLGIRSRAQLAKHVAEQAVEQPQE